MVVQPAAQRVMAHPVAFSVQLRPQPARAVAAGVTRKRLLGRCVLRSQGRSGLLQLLEISSRAHDEHAAEQWNRLGQLAGPNELVTAHD